MRKPQWTPSTAPHPVLAKLGLTPEIIARHVVSIKAPAPDQNVWRIKRRTNKQTKA